MGSKNKSAAPATAAEWKRGTWKDGKYKNQSGTIFAKNSGQGPTMGPSNPKKKKGKGVPFGKMIDPRDGKSIVSIADPLAGHGGGD